MATPTKSQAVSTPKLHFSTPSSSRLMASPRPGTSSNSNRPFAHKSPAIKTPASAHGHYPSVSSHPSSTPLAAATLQNELLNLDSPAAALINSLGGAGLTPLGSGAEGLGITTNITSGAVPTVPATPEAERQRRLLLVASVLKDRIAGHGITREGVERIAQLQGFITLWDDNNLSIAGNCVDLEVNFEDDGRDDVRDVSLKLNLTVETTESEEPIFQERGTQVIKDNLKFSKTRNDAWKDLEQFAANVQYLGQLDRTESGTPCFNAVTDLYGAFQKIWDAEKESLNNRTEWQRVRQGNVGRPAMDRSPKLGLALDYWVGDSHFVPNIEDDVSLTTRRDTSTYTAQIGCEAGLPSTAITKSWISDKVLVPDADPMLDSDSERTRPNWRDPLRDAESSVLKSESNDIDMDKPANPDPKVLDMHFHCDLAPSVFLPVNVAANLNMQIPMLDIDQQSGLTYQAALQELFEKRVAKGQSTPVERWHRKLPVATDDNFDKPRRHSYALQSSHNTSALWCLPVRRLKFTHPKQVASVLPIARQYIVLWHLLRSLVTFAEIKDGALPTNGHMKGVQAKSRPTKRTNKKTIGSKLEDVIRATTTLSADEALPIDITLDTLTDLTKARLDVYAPLIGAIGRSQKTSFLFLGLCVCHNGAIEIRDVRGLPAFATDNELRAKLVRVLEKTEDIGLTVEWLLQETSVAN